MSKFIENLILNHYKIKIKKEEVDDFPLFLLNSGHSDNNIRKLTNNINNNNNINCKNDQYLSKIEIKMDNNEPNKMENNEKNIKDIDKLVLENYDFFERNIKYLDEFVDFLKNESGISKFGSISPQITKLRVMNNEYNIYLQEEDNRNPKIDDLKGLVSGEIFEDLKKKHPKNYKKTDVPGVKNRKLGLSKFIKFLYDQKYIYKSELDYI